jgi:hypothetical protein
MQTLLGSIVIVILLNVGIRSLLYIVVLLILLALAARIPASESLIPWHSSLLLPISLILLALTILLGVSHSYQSRRLPYNIYFHPMRDDVTEPPKKLINKIPALVIHLLIDEALLGLSSETLVVARISSLLQTFTRSRINWNIFPEEIHRELGTAIYARMVLRNAMNIPITAIWNLLTRFLEPVVRSYVVGALRSAAFGMPATYMRGSRIEVSSRLECGDFFEVSYRDVTSELVSGVERRRHQATYSQVDWSVLEKWGAEIRRLS